jgi:hypothetical protein
MPLHGVHVARWPSNRLVSIAEGSSSTARQVSGVLIRVLSMPTLLQCRKAIHLAHSTTRLGFDTHGGTCLFAETKKQPGIPQHDAGTTPLMSYPHSLILYTYYTRDVAAPIPQNSQPPRISQSPTWCCSPCGNMHRRPTHLPVT